MPARGRELDDDAVIVFAAVEATPTLDELAHGAPASRLRRQRQAEIRAEPAAAGPP